MVTKTVGPSGCDYTVDGINDEVQINLALVWANENPQNTVYLIGPFTYDIQDSLLIGSYTTLKFDSDAKLRLKNAAAWTVNKPIIGQLTTPVNNVEIYGGEIDGNYANQTESLNAGYYPMIVLSNTTNVNIHDMNLHDGAGHGVHITTGSNLIFHDNTVKNLGGDAFFADASNTTDSYSNNITVRGNSAIHIKNTANSLIHNNYIVGIDDVNGGIAGIQIEDTDGRTDYPEVYENVIIGAYGSGVLVQETGTGNSNRHKHCKIHHNTVRGCGRSQIHDFVGGCTIQGFHDAEIEYNNFDGNYHAGVLIRYPSLSQGDSIHCRRNTVSNTHKHRNSNYHYAWSGKGFANHYPTYSTLDLTNNIVYNNENGDYYGTDGAGDVPTTANFQQYVPPTTYIQDEVRNYYVNDEFGRPMTAYINRYPFRWQTKKINVSKSIGQEKPPGVDGWALEDFGFGGAEITLDCYAYSLQEMQNVIAAFYEPGIATLELGGLYSGWKISGVTAKHSTDLQLRTIIPEHTYPYNIFFLADKPIMESMTKKIRTKKVTDDQQTWNSSDVYPNNCVKNHDFHTWTQGSVVTNWSAKTSAADNNWTSVCWGVATSGGGAGTPITVGAGPRRMVINAANTTAYVTSRDTDRVYIVTLATGASIYRTVGNSPVGIEMSNDGSKVYIANYDGNSISILDTATNVVTTPLTNVPNPWELCVSPDGTKLYVTDFMGSNSKVITLSNNSINSISGLTSTCFDIVVNPQNAEIAYATYDQQSKVVVINTTTRSAISTINVGTSPNGIDITPDGTKLYVANYDSNSVTVISTATNAPIYTITEGLSNPETVTVSPDGLKLYVVNNGSNKITVYNISDNSLISSYNTGTNPAFCALTSTGSKLYVANRGTNTLSQYDLSSASQGRFVAVANSGTTNRVMTSVDGNVWSIGTTPNNNNWTSVCHLASIPLYVAVANSGVGNRVMTSADGVVWAARTSAADNDWRCVCSTGLTNHFIAVARGGTNRIMYSTTGTGTWTSVLAPTSGGVQLEWSSVCYASDKALLVAVAYTGTTQQVMTSSNGSSWTIRTTPISQAWTSVCYSPDLGMFAAVSENGTTQQAMTSTDGINWNARITPVATGLAWKSICWDSDHDCFVAVASSGTGNRVMTSADGETWKLQSTPLDNDWASVCYSPDLDKFAAVATTGTGNRVMTCASLTYNTTFDSAPTDWEFRSRGQRQSDIVYSGMNSYCIQGDGQTQRRGYMAQRIRVENGLQYVMSGTGRTQGLTQGRMRAGLYSGETELYGLEWDDEDSDWTTKHMEECIFDVDQTDLELRIFSDDYANDGAYMYCDKIFVVRAKHYDSSELGSDIITTGTVAVIPDIMVTATKLTGGTTTEGFYTPSIDPDVRAIDGNAYVLLYTETLPAKPNKRHRIDKVRARHCSDTSSYESCTRVTVQWGAGTEDDLCEMRSEYEYPDFEDSSYSPYLMGSVNQSCTVRYYGRNTHSSHRSHHKDLTTDHTEIITNKLGTGIQIYNTADPLTVMHVCNKLDPGTTMEINADGSGSFRYIENLSDVTYQTACHSRTGDTYNQNTKLLTLASTGSVIYRFDTRYPVTGVPYIVMDVVAGSPQISIAAEAAGNPGTYYLVDNNPTTDQAGNTLYLPLVQEANLSLKGSTTFYVRITPYTSQNCVINSLFIYADIVTIDAERPKIYATGRPNIFKVNMPNNTALEVSLQYRDAHRMI